MAENVKNRHQRVNLVTGEREWFFPMRYPDFQDEEEKKAFQMQISLQGFEVTWTRCGNQTYKAVMIPCKRTAKDANGTVVYVDTSEEEQHRIYLQLISDELREQDAQKQDGRCMIPDGHGGIKRCPCRVPNPNYKPGSNELKTLPVRCEKCDFKNLKQAHTVIQMSALDQEGEDGEFITYEPVSPASCDQGSFYLNLRERFLDYVAEHDPKLVELAELLTLEYSKSEASRELGKATSTVGSQTEKLKLLVVDFLKTVVTI